MLLRNAVLAAAAVAVLVYVSRPRQAERRAAPASVTQLFDRSDADGDGLLSRQEFSAAAKASATPTASWQPRERALSTPQARPQSVPQLIQPQTPVASPFEREPLPECSLVFFYHIVKTGGTTMRTVLQRQAQLGDFEYIYTDTTRKPRWQLLMHQLTHPVAKRRIIVELHSEWGLPREFFADVRRLRTLYEPLGCRVTLATVIRHPLAFYLSWYNWRAANYMPLCLWDPPREPQSRQLLGYGLPFVMAALPSNMGGRRMRIPESSPLSVLKHFDVVGLTERFDESLLVLGHATGMRHLGYARLADNLKPDHPRLAKAVLSNLLRDASLSSLNVSAAALESTHTQTPGTFKAPTAAGEASSLSMRQWSSETRDAMSALGKTSMRFVVDRNARAQRPQPADCNFYPCAGVLQKARGVVSDALCDGVTPEQMIDQMLERTSTDRAMHREAVRRFDHDLDKLAQKARTRPIYRETSPGGGLAPALATLRAHSADVQRRRDEQLGGPQRRGLCGVRLCGDPLRSCVGCEPNPVPGVEVCWPSWEDQFTPDERSVYCKRSMTIEGYDKAEIAARTYPRVDVIPCWQTCWEVMSPNASAAHGVNPTCLATDAPKPTAGSAPGKSCDARKLHCSPGCTEAYQGTLEAFWTSWKKHDSRNDLDALGIECPCGNGG